MKIDGILEYLTETKHELYPKASLDDIKRTETMIGFTLPESYCQFVTQFSNGAYLFMMQEVSAVGDGNKQISSIQNQYRQFVKKGDALPFDEREGDIKFREGGLIRKKYLVPFSLDHNGNWWCFVTKSLDEENEYPVAYLNKSNSLLYGQLNSFAAWLKILMERREEIIRTLYTDDIIYDVLGLG